MKASLKLMFLLVLLGSALRWPTVAKAGGPNYTCTQEMASCQSSCEAPMGQCTEYCGETDNYTTYYIEDCVYWSETEYECDVEQQYMENSYCVAECVSTLNSCIDNCISNYCTPTN